MKNRIAQIAAEIPHQRAMGQTQCLGAFIPPFLSVALYFPFHQNFSFCVTGLPLFGVCNMTTPTEAHGNLGKCMSQ